MSWSESKNNHLLAWDVFPKLLRDLSKLRQKENFQLNPQDQGLILLDHHRACCKTKSNESISVIQTNVVSRWCSKVPTLGTSVEHKWKYDLKLFFGEYCNSVSSFLNHCGLGGKPQQLFEQRKHNNRKKYNNLWWATCISLVVCGSRQNLSFLTRVLWWGHRGLI